MKTFKEIDIKYYDNSGNVQVRCTVPVTQDALVHYELMQSHYCKLSFKLSKPTYFLLGDFVETPYGRFELIDLTKAKDNDTIGYSYEIQFDAYYRKLKNKILKYRPNTGSQEATFSLTSKISTHIEVIMKNLAYYAKLDKSYLYDPNFEGEGTDYTYVIDASVDANAAKLITYSNTSILDAIANIAQTFGCEWWFEGNILHFGTCENTNAITDFRLNDNIVSMSSSQSQSTYANRVYAFGAARNLPSGYKNDADADITKDGVVEKRLMLPNSAECSDKNKQLLAENGFELKNGYIQVSGLREDQYVEGVTTNDDIYPRNLIKTSKVTSYEKDVEDESTPEEGDYIKRTFYRVNSLAIVNEDGEKTGDMAFQKAYILSGKNLHIVFQSGSLNGMDFECEFNPDGVSEILKDDDGNPILKDGKEQINPKSQVFEIVANEDYGRFLPDITLHPKDGDTFVLYNWDSTKLGDTLVSSASNELLTDSIKDLKKSMIDPTTYTCTAEANYSYNQGRGNLHGVGDRVNLYNKGYGDSYRSSRVIGYEFSLDIPFDGAKYYVGEKPSYSRLNAMESKIEELVYNGQSYLNGNGGSGRSIYIIKSYDSITPTDYNVFSAKAVDEQRLNKAKDDIAKGTITWEKIQKLVGGLLVGNFNNENGGSWTPDAEGRSHLITDYLEVRMKAIFEELVIKKTSTISGKEIISPAGGVMAHKVEVVTVTYNNVSQKAYRCYFLAEQEGDAVDNDFAIGDQVRSESFNVRKGTYHKVGNHFYWRLVIGRDEEPVELEGKKYHYIDLSDTDCATASDVPAKGDVLSQCGNRSDAERQNCLIFSAVDTYSPSISLYHGINSYSFANKEYVEYGVNKQTNKAFYNVYGDMYVGDRPTKENNYEGSSYIKYDSAAKQVSVKGKISAKSTVDGKELSQYIKENSAKGLTEEQVNNLINNSQVITDLQNQVDGAIETWFYEGVPTLKNAPASSWTTDKDKDTHLGDLYYDNKTGKAYRFAKDGNTYKWTIITDTDIAKALADASKAQETADGKMTVFATQPTTPYQLGDIWVNATYPSDGSTYKNEVLRCQTDKKAGSQFAIADWIKASKYTDDTVANAAKKAAEDAQKAAQTAQTNVANLGKTVTTNKKSFDNYVKDGYLEPSEIAAMAQDSKRLEDDFAAAEKSYNEVKGAEVLKSTKELTALNAAFATLTTAKKELVNYLSDISSRYNAADTNGKATIVSAVGTKFTNFQSAYSAFYDKLGLANAYITSKIYGNLGVVIGDVTSLAYLKKALMDAPDTEINGGLVLTSLIGLRDTGGNTTAGINGITEKSAKGGGIAAWFGGEMVDKDYNDGSKTPANTIFRFDGSGYVAGGAIWWGTDGRVHADPTSFIISEKNLGAYLTFFEPTWKAGSAGTSVADLVSLKPNAPFTKLGVSGDASFEGAISFHGIKLTYDATNKAIKVDGNLYATGGITAYGEGSGSSGGGGLNGSVKAYADAVKLTTENLSEIASAYSVAKLYSEIQNVASAVPSISVSVPTGGNALTGATYNASTGVITFTKGTFLTAHQSLGGYVNAIAVSGSGNAVTAVTKSGKTITFTKGATYLTSHQSLSNYYTKSSVDSLLNGKSATTHTHSVKINGITKTIAASGGDAVDLGTYLTTHQSLAAYATQNWVKNEATAHNADMVDNYHASGLFTGFSISDVANKVTISIGGTSKALNLVRAFPSGVGKNFNDIATHGNSMGMSNIAAPYASSTANYQTLNGYVNPNGQTGWHHYINLSYTDSNNTATSPNMWQTQFAIKAGTTEVYVRSRAGGKISNSAAWDAPWVRLARVTDNVASASKVANALSWSGYSSGSYNGSAAKSISIPNNTNQLTNGAGFITASASISGNAGSATKLQSSRTINGTSFNGTANIVTSYWGTTRKLWGNSVNGNADVNGSITIANTDGVYVQIGDVRLVYDKANTAIKVVKSDGTTAANFYATGGITAYGEGSGSSGGGGLNGSVKSYADALKLTSESLSEIASAYSIKALSSRIDNISTELGSLNLSWNNITGKPSTFAPSAHTHKWAEITDRITKVSQLTNDAGYLTSHQSLSDYVTKGSTLGNYVDLNTITTTGFYRTSALKDFTATTAYGQLLVIHAGGDTITQIYGGYDGRLVTRGGNPTDVGGHGYWSKWNSIAYVGDNISVFANDSGYLTSHQDISGKADKSQLANYLPLNGGAMSGVLQLDSPSSGMTKPNEMRLFLNSSKYNGLSDSPGIGFHILNVAWGNLRLTSDGMLTWFNSDNNGYLQFKASGFVIGGVESDSYVLLGGGGHKAISSLSVNYATSAGSANSVAWSNVSGRPTKVSQFTNDSGYITSSGSCSYASSAGNADTVDGYHHTSFLKLAGGTMTGRLDFTPSISSTGKYSEGMMYFGYIAHDLATNYYYIPWFGGHDAVYGYGYGNTISVGAYHQNTSDCGMYIGMSWDGNAPDTFFKFSRSGNFLAAGGITAYSSSDIRLKQDLRKLDYLGIIKAMGGTFGFAWKKDNTRSIGWIAQHVLCNPHLKDIVETDEKGYYKINYWSPKLIATAFGAIEQVGDEVSRLKARVVFLESEVQRLSGKQDGNNKKRLDNKNINLN